MEDDFDYRKEMLIDITTWYLWGRLINDINQSEDEVFITEWYINHIQETENRLKRDLEETNERIKFIENAFSEGNKKIQNSHELIREIDSYFEGMLDNRSRMQIDLDEEIKLPKKADNTGSVSYTHLTLPTKRIV